MIYCYLFTLLNTKLFLAELKDNPNILNKHCGKVIEPNKETGKVENNTLVKTETGSDYAEIEYDVADFDDYEYDIEKLSQTVDKVDKKANNEVIRATLADKIALALVVKRNDFVTAGGSDYADIEYDVADYDDNEDKEYRHSEHVMNDKKVRNVKRKDKMFVEFLIKV